jgi:hypothetical protein
VDEVLQGASEVFGPKWLSDKHLRPSVLVWSVVDTLCGGCADLLPLLEKWLSGDVIKVTKRA